VVPDPRARTRDAPRWELTDEERAKLQGKFRPLELARIAISSPRLLGELLTAVGRGAVEAAANNGSLVWVLDSKRARLRVPGAGGGANWASEEWFCQTLLPRLKGDMRALDLGCGAGRIARHVATEVRSLTCVDVSGVLLSEARANLDHLANVEFVRNRRYALTQLADVSFDLAFSQGVFSYLDMVAALALLDEIHRVIRPGGMSVVNFATIDRNGGADYALKATRVAARRGRISGSTSKPYVVAQVQALHELVGLEVVDVVAPTAARPEPTIFVAVRPQPSPA
jgi:2-polyprenyl-3-methyl-5-hydroxy-6-metoxy-1,4-benzoquinol methylase